MGTAINDRSGQSVPASQPTRLRVDGGGAIKSLDYFTGIAAGVIPGTAYRLGLGNNPSIDTNSTPEDVWSGGGLYPWMAAASSLEIVSDSAADAAAGTGMRTVQIQGLDANYVELNQTVTLNGTTPVAVPQQLLRINRCLIQTAGSGGTNAGTVVVRVAGGGTTYAHIPVGFGSTRSSNFTTPAGKTLFITTYNFSINRPSTQRDATLATAIRLQNGAHFLSNEVSVDGNPFQRIQIPPAPLPEKTDFVFRCTYVSANATDLTASWTGFVRTND